MKQSALLGQAPLDAQDAMIAKGLRFQQTAGISPARTLVMIDPNATNLDDSWSTSMVVGTAFAVFFILLLTITRVYMRYFVTGHAGYEDLVIIPGALGCLYVLISTVVQCTLSCLGRHVYLCTYKEAALFYTLSQSTFPMFYFSVFTVKLSIALQYRRFTERTGGKWRYVHGTLITLIGMMIITFTLLEIFKCIPIRVSYSLEYAARFTNADQVRCLSLGFIEVLGRIFHILTDLALLIVPVVIIKQTRMAKRRKARLFAVFAIGSVSTAASIVVLSINVGLRSYSDLTWSPEVRAVYTLISVDITFLIAVANLPALNPLADGILQRISSYMSLRHQQSSDAGGQTHGTLFLKMGRRPHSDPAFEIPSTLDLISQPIAEQE